MVQIISVSLNVNFGKVNFNGYEPETYREMNDIAEMFKSVLMPMYLNTETDDTDTTLTGTIDTENKTFRIEEIVRYVSDGIEMNYTTEFPEYLVVKAA